MRINSPAFRNSLSPKIETPSLLLAVHYFANIGALPFRAELMLNYKVSVVALTLLITGCAAAIDKPIESENSNAALDDNSVKLMVLVEIGPNGLVTKATIDQSSGYSTLDETALSMIRRARFKPYVRRGVALPAKAKVPFHFTNLPPRDASK